MAESMFGWCGQKSVSVGVDEERWGDEEDKKAAEAKTCHYSI